MGSIQGRLTVYIVVGAAVLLMIVGLTMDRLLRVQLEQEFNRSLLEKAMTLVSLTEQDTGIVEFDFVEELMPEFGMIDKPEYFELRLADGTTVSRSPSLGDGALLGPSRPLDEPRFRDVILRDGREGRVVEFSFVPREDFDEEDQPTEDGASTDQTQTEDPGTVSPTSEIRVDMAVAKGRERLNQLMATMRTSLLVPFVLLMGALVLLVRFSIDRGLRPLRQITAQVQELDANRLNTRITADSDSAELAPIISQLNRLLERLDETFHREKRFSGNVAHELRTPISELRALAEVGQKWPAEPDMVKGFFTDLVDLADDMESTVTNLLTLARLDAGSQAVERTSINLSGLIETVWDRLITRANVAERTLVNRVSKHLHVDSDNDKLTLILLNILSNAAAYSPQHASIVVEADVTEGQTRCAISNIAADLTEADLPLMFERFWRKDQSRTEGRHAGLGLSVVKALAEVLDLEIVPELDEKGRLTITIVFAEPHERRA